MSTKDIAVAVGSSGSATGHGVLRALDGWGQCSALLACDINPRHLVAAAQQFAFCQVPAAARDGYVVALIDLLRDNGATSFYPIHDAEIAKCAAQMAVFSAAGLQVLAPPHTAVSIVRDKLHMAQVLQRAGLPTPETQRLDLAQWTGAPLHYKPRTGVGSQGVGHATTLESLTARRASADAADFIVQPFIPGQEITIDVFALSAGDVLAVCCRERLEVKAGVCTKARLFHDAGLRELAAALSRAIGLVGAFCFQVRGDSAQGHWQIIDINPRVGGGTPMSRAAGLDFASAHVALFHGLDPQGFFKVLPRDDVFVTRSYQEHVAWPANPS